MTTYSTSFDSYTADVQPSDWTARWVTANNTWAVRSKASTEGGKVLENTGTVDGRHLLSWDAIDGDANRANVEVLGRMRSSSTLLSQLRLIVRGSGSAASETGYMLDLPSASATDLRIIKASAGTLTSLGTAYAYTFAANTWYFVRFRANGTSLKARVWADGEVEPSVWHIDITDSSISAAGWTGVGNLESTGTRDFDWISVGTNGDTAPLTTGGATEVRTSQAAMEAALATVAQARISQLIAEVAISAPIAGEISQLVVEVAFSNAAAPVTQQPQMIVLL
jgi:hypothetical protein